MKTVSFPHVISKHGFPIFENSEPCFLPKLKKEIIAIHKIWHGQNGAWTQMPVCSCKFWNWIKSSDFLKLLHLFKEKGSTGENIKCSLSRKLLLVPQWQGVWEEGGIIWNRDHSSERGWKPKANNIKGNRKKVNTDKKAKKYKVIKCSVGSNKDFLNVIHSHINIKLDEQEFKL